MEFGGSVRVFQGKTRTPSPGLMGKPANQSVFLLHAWLNFKMETLSSSKKSITFYQTTWCHIPEDRALHGQQCEKNQISHNLLHSYLYTETGAMLLNQAPQCYLHYEHLFHVYQQCKSVICLLVYTSNQFIHIFQNFPISYSGM
jgi:hypothetical protein